MRYDNASRVGSIRWHDGATPLAYFEFDRGAGGIINRLHQPVAGGTAYYSYDVNDRLTKESWEMEVGQWGNGPWGQFAWGGGTPYFEYAYDLAGNRTRKRRYEGPWTYYEYAADNSLTKSFLSDESAATYYEYDKTGSCEKIVAPEGTAYFAYNAAGMVKEFSKAGKTFQFAYDGNLQRHAIVEDGTATYYLWDGLRLLETRNADGTLKARFTHGHTPIEGIGSCVEVYRASDSKRFCMLYDHRGTAHVLLDESKTEVARRIYSAFGELISESGTWPDEVPFGYQSNWTYLCDLPDGSPLYLSPTRVYHAGTGAFLQRDFLPEAVLVQTSSWGNALGQWDTPALSLAALRWTVRLCGLQLVTAPTPFGLGRRLRVLSFLRRAHAAASKARRERGPDLGSWPPYGILKEIGPYGAPASYAYCDASPPGRADPTGFSYYGCFSECVDTVSGGTAPLSMPGPFGIPPDVGTTGFWALLAADVAMSVGCHAKCVATEGILPLLSWLREQLPPPGLPLNRGEIPRLPDGRPDPSYESLELYMHNAGEDPGCILGR